MPWPLISEPVGATWAGVYKLFHISLAGVFRPSWMVFLDQSMTGLFSNSWLGHCSKHGSVSCWSACIGNLGTEKKGKCSWRNTSRFSANPGRFCCILKVISQTHLPPWEILSFHTLTIFTPWWPLGMVPFWFAADVVVVFVTIWGVGCSTTKRQ